MSTKVKTGEVRFGYAFVHTPRKNGDSEKESYSAMIIVDKEDKATIKAIEDAIEAAKQLGKTEKWGGKIPPTLKLPLRDGDEERPDSPELAGKLFLNAKSNNKPDIMVKDPEFGTIGKITDPADFYSGCHGKVTLNFYAYTFNGNKGVGCGLNNIFKTKDGEPLSGGGSGESDFADE